jgi:hypothetical protein
MRQAGGNCSNSGAGAFMRRLTLDIGGHAGAQDSTLRVEGEMYDCKT